MKAKDHSMRLPVKDVAISFEGWCDHRSGLLVLVVIIGLSFSHTAIYSGTQLHPGLNALMDRSQPKTLPSGEVNSSPAASKKMKPITSFQGKTPKLLSLRLVPGEVTLWGAKASQHFLVLGKYADGVERDMTGQSRFSISNSYFTTVDESGRLTALADGTAVLKAEASGRVAKANIRIEGSQEKSEFSFQRDIGGILTKRGCNDSHCHGGVKGKGGLKLSLFSLYPKEDYQWIVEGGTFQVLSAEPGEPRNPRINLKDPEQSLLLLKPTFSVPHDGGQRFSVGSPDYQTLLNWIRDGAPYGRVESARVERLEVFPSDPVLESKETRRLLVTAYLSNGQRKDITDQVFYQSNNSEIATVTPEGIVEAVKAGEADIQIRVPGHILNVRVGVIARRIQDWPKAPSKNFIDDHVFARLRKLNIIPAKLSSDEEFLRRVCLDVTGILPPPDRVREFLADQGPQKRDKLIEVLLESAEYVDYWTYRFGDVFRVGSDPGNAIGVHMYWPWIRARIAQNTPYDQVARERIAAQGYDAPAMHYSHSAELIPLEKRVAEQVRVFMGRRLDCAQCHNHPYETWSQDQFWGMAAFFSRMTRTSWNTDQALFDDPEGQELGQGVMGNNTLTFVKAINPRKKIEVQPTFLDGTILPENKRPDLRVELAKWITSHPYFAEAIVNRMWSYFFGKGIVNPVDDFRLNNPPTHADLLNALARDFREHGHDLKRLIRLIVQSRTYQLSSLPNETNKEDEVNYSRALPRPLDAEVLLDAISSATGIPETFETQRGERAPIGTRAINLKAPGNYPHRFFEIYGRPRRDTVPERDGRPNLSQGFHMLVGSTYRDKLSKEGGRVDQLLKSGATDRKIIEELYLAALSRLPGKEEQTKIEEMMARAPSRRKALEALLWSLISSREFAYNH